MIKMTTTGLNRNHLTEGTIQTHDESGNREVNAALSKSTNTAFFIALALLLAGIFFEYISILRQNSGRFIYTLDDAYIHLSLAENIIDGHYGLNAGEFSAPSSSILWPFLLAPFTKSDSGEHVPLLINIAATIGTLWLFYRILEKSVLVETGKTKIISVCLLLLIAATNLLGLIFTGMEHSLQLLFSAGTLWGLVSDMEGERETGWLAAGIILGPLIRYENIALSAGALLYLLLRRRWKLCLISSVALAVCIGAFSLFLMNLNLRILPTSTFVKSMILSSGGSTDSLLNHFLYSLRERTGALLLTGMFTLICFGFLSKVQPKQVKFFAVAVSVSIFMHLAGGLYGWYHRYEIYIWAVTILAVFYAARFSFSAALQSHRVPTITIVTVFGILVSLFYVLDLRTVPTASNNIYEQHFQMHRFAVDYYRGPVAVNDVGYVSFRNPHHVLDLFGLTSQDALNLRIQNPGSDWMNQLTSAHNIQLAMIYDNVFRQIPPSWFKVGELRLSKKRITPYHNVVSFYALNRESVPPIFNLLYAFQKTLPEGTTLNLIRPRI